MKIAEAIAYAKEQTEIFAGKHRVFLYLAIDALERQMPRKPLEVNERGSGEFYCLDLLCPSCNTAIIGQPYRPNCCKHCGQKLDWSE